MREGPPSQALYFQQCRNKDSALKESCLGELKVSPVVDFHCFNFPKGSSLTLLMQTQLTNPCCWHQEARDTYSRS